MISTNNLTATTSTLPNAVFTNISSSTLNISTGITSSSILNTGLISTNNLTAMTSTLPNAVFTNISTGTINISTGITTNNLLVTGLLSGANAYITTLTAGTLLNTTKLIATGSINTIGSFIISGASASINGSINNNRCLVVGSATQGAISIVNTGEARYHLYNGSGIKEWLFGQKSNTNHDFTFTTLVAGVETDRMVVDINGNLGIGTPSPISRFQVTNAGAPTSMVISNATSGSTKLELCIPNAATEFSTSARAGDSVIRTHTGANLIFQTSHSGAAHMTIVSTGSVGIGTTAPSSLLTVNGTFNAISSTIPNAVFTNISTGTINTSTGITTSSILNTGLISTANLYATSSTISNAVSTNITSSTLLVNTLVSTPNLQVTNISAGYIYANNEIYSNGDLLFGIDNYYIASTSASSWSQTSFTPKLTGTTPSLIGGTYMLSTQYQAGAGGSSSGRSLELRTFVDGVLTGTVGNIPLISSIQSIPCYSMTNITLSNAIHTILVDFRTTNAATAAIVQQLKVWLYRIA